MRCKKICKILLTEYYDHIIDDSLYEEIRHHAGQCEGCRLLMTQVDILSKKNLAQDLKTESIPDLWPKIRQEINKKGLKHNQESLLAKSLDFLQTTLYMYRRASLGLAVSALTLLLVVSVISPRIFLNKNINEYTEEQTAFYASLIDNDSSIDVVPDFGTSIEYFFL